MPLYALAMFALIVFPVVGNGLYFGLDEIINNPERDSWSLEVVVRIGFLVVAPVLMTLALAATVRLRTLWVVPVALASGAVSFLAIVALFLTCDVLGGSCSS
ncbi:MAG: hypothetical protein ABR581_06115 [Thermoleophilaceae bacterium]